VNAETLTTTWDDFLTVSKFFSSSTKNLSLAMFDWKNAYRQILTAPLQWPYLMVRDFDGKIFLDTRVTFGGIAGCRSFGRPADAWREILLSEFNLSHIFRWVNYTLFVKEEGNVLSMDNIIEHSISLGVKTNPKKFRNFGEEQKFIGFIWNGRSIMVRLPKTKLARESNSALTS
jgi:hypothetical protein